MRIETTIRNLKNILLEYMFDHAGKQIDYYNIYKMGYSLKDIVAALNALGYTKKELLFFDDTFFFHEVENGKKKPWFSEMCEILLDTVYKSSKKNAIVIDGGQYGILRISPDIKAYRENLKIIDGKDNFKKFGLLVSLEIVKIRDVSPDFLEIINTLPKLKKLDMCLEDEITNQKWPAITNKNIRELVLDGWSGKYNGITLPTQLVSLKLMRRLGRFVNSGLPEMPNLKNIEALHCFGIFMQPILNHPSVEHVYLTRGKDSKISISSSSRIKKLSIDHSRVEYCLLESDRLEKLEVASKKNLRIECEKECYALKTIAIEGKEIMDINFLQRMPEVEELTLSGLEELDCNDLLNLKKIKKLSLIDIKTLRNVDALNMLKNLTYFEGRLIKSMVDTTNNLDLRLDTLWLVNIHPKILDQFLIGSTFKIFRGYFLKNIDFSHFRDPKKLEELNMIYCNTKNTEMIENMSNIKVLLLHLKQKISLKFLFSMTHLKELKIPAYSEQKNLILQYCQSLKNCKIEFIHDGSNSL